VVSVSLMKIAVPLIAISLMLPATAVAAGGAVSSAHPRASEAGQEILRAGGSATDAAMAMMLALTVVEPQSSGIGGGGFLIHHDSKTGKVATIDGRETAPKSATTTRFVGPDGKPMGFLKAFPGGLSVGIPGNMALMAEAHKKWGKLRWAKLFAPAIKLASDGYVVNAALADRLSIIKGIWKDFPQAQSIYWENGQPKTTGAVVKNPALAAYLRTLAKGGPRTFYSGANAKAISKAVSTAPRNPSVITTAEIGAYRATPRDAVCTTYRVYKLCGMGPPSSGATTVFQILGMIERFDMKAMGKDDPRSWHVIAEAMRLAYADRETYLADAGFVKVPVAGLLDKSYISSRSAMISADTSLAAYPAGKPPGAMAMTTAPSSEVAGTTHFIAVDGSGSVASMTSTTKGPLAAN
jgi:gamma-glutamyltranspeptidase / glutathione hydrolase